jgi:hypothetical protein
LPSSDDDKRARLLEETEAKAWRPATGDSLSGEVVSVEMEYDGYGSVNAVLLIRPPEGPAVKFHASPATAKKAIRKLDPEPGDMIAISYHGMVEPDDGYPCHDDQISVSGAD